MYMRLILFFCLNSVFNIIIAKPMLSYNLFIKEPHTHYVEVEIQVNGIAHQHYLDFKMPVWTPGSYLVREFSKNVEQVHAFSGDQKIGCEKINKNTWRVYAEGQSNIVIKYNVYAFEHSVRTSFVDASHATLNGASIFMWVDSLQNQPIVLTVYPYSRWKKISTGLLSTKNNIWQFEAPNYDVLIDSPIEIGNHHTFEVVVKSIPHHIAIVGVDDFNEKQLKKDFKSIIESAMSIIEDNPFQNYTFIIHATSDKQDKGGGLEHLNSTHIIVLRSSFYKESDYKKMLATVAHEYFHAWNVKRIRPVELGPFDYSNENYTKLLYVSEGFTEYYENYILFLAGLFNEQAYLAKLADDISVYENKPGKYNQTLAESSFDAWIKYYRPTKNSSNSTISYYEKGGIVALLLNLEILYATDSKKSLTDVFRLLYSEYYKKENRGFTDLEFKQAVEKIIKKNMDTFFDNYIYGTNPFDYNKYFSYVGLYLSNRNEVFYRPSLGVELMSIDGKVIIKTVRKDGSAYREGLNEKDELVAFNGYRLYRESDISDWLNYFKVGDKIVVTIARDGKLMDIYLVLTKDDTVDYVLMPIKKSIDKEQLYKKWLLIN